MSSDAQLEVLLAKVNRQLASTRAMVVVFACIAAGVGVLLVWSLYKMARGLLAYATGTGGAATSYLSRVRATDADIEPEEHVDEAPGPDAEYAALSKLAGGAREGQACGAAVMGDASPDDEVPEKSLVREYDDYGP